MIMSEELMTPRTRRRPATEQAPVVAPLAVLVCSALLVLAQLYLAIPLAPVIGGVLGRGSSAAAAALGTTYALAYGIGFLIFGPLSDRYGRKPILVPGMAVLALVTGGLAAASSLPVIAVLRTVQGLVAVAAHWDWCNVDRFSLGRHSGSGLCPGGGGIAWLALGVRTGSTRPSDRILCYRDDLDRAAAQW
jgi:MFS family permease